MRRFVPIPAALIAILLSLSACGARSELYATGQDSGESFDAVVRSDHIGPCWPLASHYGDYQGRWQGIVNCLEEKHPSEGTLRFQSRVEDDGSLYVEGDFSGIFSNGEILTSRVAGHLACSGAVQVDLKDIEVGHAQVGSAVSGWLRGWAFSDHPRRFSGTWRIDQWEPLCLGAGRWQAMAVDVR